MFVATLIGLGLWQVSRTKNIELSKTMVLFWVGFLFFLLPLTYPNNEISYPSTARILFLFGGLTFYTALVQIRFREKERLELLYIILAAIVIQSTLGLVQYYVSEHHWFLMKKTRLYGTFTQRNLMATFMATGIGISLYLTGKDPALLTSTVLTDWHAHKISMI